MAKCEGVDPRHCQIVDAHYFRGRLSASEAEQRAKLLTDRVFDDVLMREGIVTHYLPVTPAGEKGIDVWLAVEVLELPVYKWFDVSVLITGDRDFVPLVRKLNTLGTRVMVLGWAFQYVNDRNEPQTTETSQYLLGEATYPVLMSDEIDDRTRKSDPLIKDLFLARKESRVVPTDLPVAPLPDVLRASGTVLRLADGFGFIKAEGAPNNVLFHYWALANCDFNDLEAGDAVTFVMGTNDKGHVATDLRVEKSTVNLRQCRLNPPQRCLRA